VPVFYAKSRFFQNATLLGTGLVYTGLVRTISLRSQIVTLKRGQHLKYLPHAFTEQGVAMLSSVLNSKRAIEANIHIIRTFVRIREMIISNKELRLKIEKLEKKCDNNFWAISKVINRFLKEDVKKENKIGFEVKK